MKMVSAAKLRRAQEAIERARPYAVRMHATLAELAGSTLDEVHPLLEVHEDRRALEVVVITSDRGLAGAFNSNVIKEVEALLAERESEFATVGLTLLGKKAVDYFGRHPHGHVSHAAPIDGDVTYEQAAEVAADLSRRYTEGELDEVVLVVSEFISTMTQRPRVVPVLPVVHVEGPSDDEKEKEEDEDSLPFEIEPDPATLLAALVPKAVETQIYRALLENQAGEHAARMTAMESATKNTEELIETLTLQYNRARQAAITSELVEIVTGAQALD